jgi:predicted RNA methylase
MTLSEMRELLARENIQLTKSLGQNFLHDANQLQRIVDAAELSRNDKVLEIGPGLGPLTELLLENAGEVLAIEMDARLVDFLQKNFGLEEAARTGEDSPQREVPLPDDQTAETGMLGLLHDDALVFLKR